MKYTKMIKTELLKSESNKKKEFIKSKDKTKRKKKIETENLSSNILY